MFEDMLGIFAVQHMPPCGVPLSVHHVRVYIFKIFPLSGRHSIPVFAC